MTFQSQNMVPLGTKEEMCGWILCTAARSSTALEGGDNDYRSRRRFFKSFPSPVGGMPSWAMNSPAPRICSSCKVDQTPFKRELYVCRNSKGYSIGVFCADCLPEAKAIVDDVARMHGAFITLAGRYLCAPVGVPDLRSAGELRKYLAERRSHLQHAA